MTSLRHHKVNDHHSYLNNNSKMYETILHTLQPYQGINQKQHRQSIPQNDIQYSASETKKRPVSCLAWLYMKFIMLTNTQAPTIIDILILFAWQIQHSETIDKNASSFKHW